MRRANSISAALACCLLCCAFCAANLPGRAFAASPARAPEKIYRLAFTLYYPDKHPALSNVFAPWALEIAEESKNRLFITCYGPDILIPEEMHFEALRRGNTAISQQSTGLAQGHLPVSSFLYMPEGVSSSAAGTAALWRMFKNTPEMRREYENYKLLSLHASAPVQLHLTFKLKGPGGLKHKRILCADVYLASMLRAAGAIPVMMPENAYYEAIEQGKADGVALPFDMIAARGLEKLPFAQSVCVNICTLPYWTMMHKTVWEALPKDLQRLIDQKSGEALGLKTAEALDLAAAAAKAEMAERGVQIKELNASEAEAWREALAPGVRALWLEQLNAAMVRNPENLLTRAYAR